MQRRLIRIDTFCLLCIFCFRNHYSIPLSRKVSARISLLNWVDTLRRSHNVLAGRLTYTLMKRLNPFPHTKDIQQTTLKLSMQNYRNSLYMKVFRLNRVENIMANDEIAHNEQFSSFATMVSKLVCCRGVIKRLDMGNGCIFSVLNVYIN